MVKEKEYRVVGMSRSGNHAIINWILKQTRGRYCFLNCVEPKTNPFESARPMSDGRSIETNIETLDIDAERAGRWSEKDLLLYSYEDCFLGMIASPRYERRRDAMVGRSGRRRDILILRDPFNLFASRRKKGGAHISDQTAMRIWKQHARQFLKMRRYLPSDTITINYNAWAGDVAYRRRLAADLDITFSDAAFDDIPSCNGGSSFDGRRFDGRASEMRVYERWRHFANDEAYWSIFDSEVIDLSEQIFADAPGADLRPSFSLAA